MRIRLRVAVVALLVSAQAFVAAVSPAPAALAAEPGPSAVLAGAQSLGSGAAYPAVVADGAGVFHAVIRDSTLGTRILYLRSSDGGRHWARSAILSGDLAATMPAIAADGAHLAVGFVAEWIDANGVHNQAPYLTTSDDGGASWTGARRLGTWATAVSVAVDGDRVWTAWSGRGGIRGTTDGGATFFVSQDLDGVARAAVAAGDGVVSAAYTDLRTTHIAVGQAEHLDAFRTVDDARMSGVAAGDGRAYALVQGSTGISVLGAEPGHAPARVDVPIDAGSATIAAGRGTLAVATCASGTVYISESTNWPAFGEAVAATTFPTGGDCIASITAAAPAPQLTPRFDWTVAAHYVDSDGDGLPDPANISGTAADNVIVGDNDTLAVTLDGCASQTSGSGSAITHYIWSVNGTQVADLDHCAGPEIEVRSGSDPTIRLELRDDAGGRAVTARTITPKDLVIVSLGDSVASGEGSPVRPGNRVPSLAWSDPSCHRSSYAGPALAARQLEDSDPHSAVTFVQLACSGAAISDTFADPAAPAAGDDPATGGITDDYRGVAPTAGSLRPSQIAQMTQLLGARTADAVLVSAGANDVRFSDTLKACLKPVVGGVIGSDCSVNAVAATHDTRMAELPARYDRLADALAAAGVPTDRVHLTEYFDPTGDRYGFTDLRCIGNLDPDLLTLVSGGVAGGLITDDEATWARGHLISGLNDAVRQAGAEHGWDVIGGIAASFAAHGYCADDPWIVRFGASQEDQGDENGTFHPNRAGQEVYGDAIASRLGGLVAAPVTDVDATAPTGAAAVGDLVVLATDAWASAPELRSIALTTTGGAPTVGAVRRLQNGPGFGAAAVDGSASAALWIAVTGATTTSTEGYAGQLGSRPDHGVRRVQIVQAAADATRLVTNRKTSVLADLWSSVDGSSAAQVTTKIVARANGVDTPVLPATTQEVSLHPGSNRVLLPVGDTVAAPDDSVLVATVSLTDPPGATPEESGDDTLSSDPAAFIETMRTRPLKIALLPLDLGGSTVACTDIAGKANTWVAWAQQVLPVPDGGVNADLSCLPEVLLTGTGEPGVAQALGELDLLAREAGLDAVVAVAPNGWLGQQLGDASVGRAGVTGRSAIIDLQAPPATLAHELGHTLGMDHTEAAKVSGAWVSRAKVIDGTDFMAASWDGVTTEWVGGATWDALTGSLNEANAPQVPTGGGSAYWIRGSMPVEGDSVRLDPFLDDGDEASPPPAGSSTGRLTVVPVAADGSPTGEPVRIGLDDVDGAGGSVVTKTFAQKVLAPAGTNAFRILLDGDLVEERALGHAPTIAITAPAAGATVARSDAIHVEWTVSDPDTGDAMPAPTVHLLVSDDDGATWRPLASGLHGSSADLAVPRDLGGDAIRIRAVVSDGVHVRMADSDRFAVVAATGQDRLVFATSAADAGQAWDEPTRIGTMRPDGSDVRLLPLPTVRDQEQHPVAHYAAPVWGPDAERIYYVSWEQSDGGGCKVVDSANADGSDVRREVSPSRGDCSTQVDQPTACLSMSADGDRLLFDADVYEKGPSGWTRIGRPITDTSGWQGILPLNGFAGITASAQQCGVISPDGTLVAGVADYHGWRVNEDGSQTAGSVRTVVVVPAKDAWQDGGDRVSEWSISTGSRVVSAWDEALWRSDDALGPDPRQLSVSWSGTGSLLVVTGTPGWEHAQTSRLDLSTLQPDRHDDIGQPLPVAPAAATALATVSLPGSGDPQRAAKPAPDGRLYGDTDCGWYIDAAAHSSADVVDASRCIGDVDWGRPLGNTVPQARLAFVAGDRDVEHPAIPAENGTQPTWDRVGIMAPDGSDVTWLDAPAIIDVPPTAATPRAWQRPANYASPVWAPDGRVYFLEKGSGVLRSALPDGSDVRVEFDNGGYSAPGYDLNTHRPCLSLSSSGPYGDFLWLENFTVYGAKDHGQKVGDVMTSLQDAGGDVPPSAYRGLFTIPEPSGILYKQGVGCPVLSPDGRYVARVELIRGDLGDGGYGVAVAPVRWRGDMPWLDAGFGASPWMNSWRFVTTIDSAPLDGVSWTSDHGLLVTGEGRQIGLDLSTLTPPTSPDDPLIPADVISDTALAIPASAAQHRAAKSIPGGGVYGDVDCGLYSGGVSITTYQSPYVPGTSTCFTDFAWNTVGPAVADGTGGEGGGDIPALVVDPSLAPDPADPPADPDPVVVPAGAPAPGAGSDASLPDPGAIGPGAVTLAPGETRDIALENATRVPVRYEVDPAVEQPTGAGSVSVLGAVDAGTGLVVTDGDVRLSADAATDDASGPAHLRVRIAGTQEWTTIEIRIGSPARPALADDEVAVTVGTERILPTPALLGNDAPGVAGARLQLVAVTGYGAGTAFLDADGAVHVLAATAGTSTFQYRAGESGSLATAVATVTVRATDAPAVPPTPSAPPETGVPGAGAGGQASGSGSDGDVRHGAAGVPGWDLAGTGAAVPVLTIALAALAILGGTGLLLIRRRRRG